MRQSGDARLRRRMAAVLGCLLLVLTVLLGQLWRIQVTEGKTLSAGAVRQRAVATSLGPGRGDILDRNGNSLTGAHFASVSLNVGGAAGAAAARTTTAGAAAARTAAAGTTAAVAKVRYGPDSLAHHLVGYVRGDDNRGVSGVELAMDRFLRSDQAPQALAFIDGQGRPIPGLGVRLTPETGRNNVWLTIDAQAQAAAEKALVRAGAPGAAVVLDAASGQVLAMASRPDFAPDRVADYLHANGAPLVNRATSAYAPGSVFKLVVLAAALETGATHPSEVFECPGYVDVGDRRIPCLAHPSASPAAPAKITVVDALAQSCNTTFIKLGLRIGPEAIARQARLFGLGQTTGTGLPEEAAGNIPAPAGAASDGGISRGDIANMAIGQGDVMVTPLQVARMIAAITQRGVISEPSVFGKVVNQDDITVWRPGEPVLARAVTPATALVLREGMTRATKTGTSRAAQPAALGLSSARGLKAAAGKSGTAETPGKTAAGEPINNAWFAGYYPGDHPRWVIVVVLETTGTGGGQAAPVFAEIAGALVSAAEAASESSTPCVRASQYVNGRKTGNLPLSNHPKSRPDGTVM